MGGLLGEGLQEGRGDGMLDVMVVPLLPEGDDSEDGEGGGQNDSWMIQVCRRIDVCL